MFKVIVLGVDHNLVSILDAVDLFCNLDYLGLAFFELGSDSRDDVSFLAEDEGREEGDDFFGLVFGKDIFEDELSEDQFTS